MTGDRLTGDHLTQDAFLGGRVSVLQPATGYRAATDPVFLAASVPALTGERVLELGSGTGVAALCLMARVPGVVVTGVERQRDYAGLARQNAASAGVALSVIEGDVASMPPALKQDRFDHVMTNPPYFAAGTAPGDAGRAVAHMETMPLSDWLKAGAKRLVPGGSMTVIHRAERLGEILTGFAAGRIGEIRVLPLSARTGRAAGRIIVQGRKGRKSPLRLLAPLILHDGAAHSKDGDDASAAAQAVLRDGKALQLI